MTSLALDRQDTRLADDDAPLRLALAAERAYPDGSMTASGLRREAKAGRLVIERVAGKDYTTLAEIQKMRALCRVQQKAPVSTSASEPEDPPSGSSATATTSKALASLNVSLDALRKRSQNTSPKSTSRPRHAGRVIHLQSRSPT